MIAVAIVKHMKDQDENVSDKFLPIIRSLDIPDTVKANLNVSLKPYLQAIEVSGYEKNKIRKLMIVGNTGN